MEAVSGGTAVLVELLDRHGHVRMRERLMLDAARPRFTIGRSLAADVVLDDEHAAPVHAEVELTSDGRLVAGDLGTQNGIIVGGVRRHDRNGLIIGQTPIRIGRTLVRMRTSADQLPPEKVDRHEHRLHISSPAPLAIIALVMAIAQVAYTSWLGAPRDLATTLLTAFSISGAVALSWIATWALLSRIMLGEWRWFRHIAIALGISVILTVVQWLVSMATFAWTLPTWRSGSIWASLLALGVALYLHLRSASAVSWKRAAIIAAVAPILLGVSATWVYDHITRDDVRRISAPRQIYPPYMRMTPAEPIDTFFSAAAALRADADQKRRALAADDDNDTTD